MNILKKCICGKPQKISSYQGHEESVQIRVYEFERHKSCKTKNSLSMIYLVLLAMNSMIEYIYIQFLKTKLYPSETLITHAALKFG